MLLLEWNVVSSDDITSGPAYESDEKLRPYKIPFGCYYLYFFFFSHFWNKYVRAESCLYFVPCCNSVLKWIVLFSLMWQTGSATIKFEEFFYHVCTLIKSYWSRWRVRIYVCKWLVIVFSTDCIHFSSHFSKLHNKVVRVQEKSRDRSMSKFTHLYAVRWI